MSITPSILVGTASWAAQSLTGHGRFYPDEVRTPEQRLRHYATQFPMVEVDSSYYGMPTAANAQRWAERTPHDFVFNVKAFRLFTGHQTPAHVLHRDIQHELAAAGVSAPLYYYRSLPREVRDELWRRFIDALAPLRNDGKLCAVHFQFAPWMLCNAQGRAHVAHCVEKMQGQLLAVEFRHRSWFHGDSAQGTLAFERELGVAHVVVDSPQLAANTVPAIWEATTDKLAVVRLHGRNEATWNQPRGSNVGSNVRFNYDYSDDELTQLAPKIKALAARVRQTHVVFNNNHEDQGQRNGVAMRRLLKT